MRPNMTTEPTTTAARDAARKARAIAYLQEKPPKGQGWTAKRQAYIYDKEEDDGRERER